MGDTSQGTLSMVRETVAGAPPANPAFRRIDIVDEDLVMSTTQVRSAAVTKERVVRSSRRAGKETGGGFRFELYSGQEVNQILEGLMGNDFAADTKLAKGGGNIVRTHTFERQLGPNDYRRFHGVRLGSAEFTIAPEQHIMVRVAGTGATMTTANAPIAGATYAEPTPGEKLTALDVLNIQLSGGLTAPLDFETLSFTVNNQLATRKRLGPVSVRSVGAGQLLATGTARIYVDKALADAFIAEKHFDMTGQMAYAGSGFNAIFQNVAITEYNDNNTGNNDEFMAAIGFEATLDADFASSFAFQTVNPA